MKLLAISIADSEISINIVVHLDYGLKNILYETLEEISMRGYTFSVDIAAQGESLTQSTSVHSGLIAHEKKLTAIAGYVLDVNGNPLQNVEVELYNSTEQCIRSTITDEDGFFYFIDIDEGDYEVHICYDGYIDIEIVTAFIDEMTIVLFVIPDEY